MRLAVGALAQLVGLTLSRLARLLSLPRSFLTDVLSLPHALLQPVVGPRARARGDLLGRLVRALEQPAGLLGHLLEGVPDRRLRRRGDLELRDHAVHLLHVAIDGVAVVAPQRDREVDVPDLP